jgi:autotransporter-associated beta strand protein
MKTPPKTNTSKRGRLAQIKTIALSAGLMASAAAAFGQSFWSGGTSDFNNATFWSGSYIGGTPNCCNDSGAANVVLIQPGDPIWQHGDTLAGQGSGATGSYLQTGSTNNTGGGNWMRLGIGGGGTVGYYTLSNGVVNVGGQTHLGENGTGYLEVDGGIYNASTTGQNPGLCAGDGDWGANCVGTLTLNGGMVNILNGQETWFGEGGGCTGNLVMSGGTFNANNWFVFGRNGGVGYGTMTGGTINFTGGGQFLVGGGGIGSLAQSGGIINVQNQYLVPQGGTAGTNILSGTAILNTHDWVAVGRGGGYGEMDISGSAAITSDTANDGGAHFDIGASGRGIVNQSGGTITDTASALYVGESSAGTWNFNAGTAILGSVIMCVNNSASGVLNLNGGLFQTTGITSPSSGAVSELSLNGATLRANANNANFIAGLTLASVGPNSVIDSQGYNITIPQALGDNGGGSITKLGSGTLTLTGANTYAGATTVNAGAFATTTASTGGGSYAIASGTTLSVQVESANASLGAASATFTGPATLTIDLNTFGTPANAPVNVAGVLTATGTTTINILSATPLPVGQVPLIQYGSPAGSGVFVLGTFPPGETGYLTNNAGLVSLVITGAGAPRWNGNVAGGVWDANTTANWIDLITSLATTYHDGEPVLFDDNASGTTTVDLTATVAPGSINFNNSSLPYSIVGTGKITGNIGLNLNGTANVSILNTGGNSFTGPVVINAGTLTVTNLANGGSPSPLGASSSSPANLLIGAATLQFSGAPVAANRGFTANAAGATIDAESNFALGGLVTVGSTASFVKTGPAQLDLTTVGVNQFSSSANPGAEVRFGPLMLDGSGGQTNHVAADMYVGDTTSTGASLILSNTTLNVDGWFGVGRINGGINNTSSATLYNSTLNCGNLTIGWDGGQPNNLSSQFITLNGSSTLNDYGAVNLPEGANSSLTFQVNGSSVFWVQNPFYICLANNTTGAVVVANSGKIIQANGWFDVGQGNNCVASLLVKDNASVSLDGDCNLADTASGANGTITVQDNATLQANNLFVGKSSSCVCTFNLAGAATGSFGNFMRLADGSSSTGNVNISGGSLTFGQYINMAGGSGSTASITMTGGSLTGGNDMTIGDQATATVTLNGGVLTVPNTVYLSRGNNVADGTMNINAGGTILAGYVNNGWAFNQGSTSPLFNPNAFNFNGGTLKSYGGANPAYSFIQANVNVVVKAGGAIIDDNGAVRYIDAALVDGGGGGGLTKLGSGALALNGVNTYTGTTLVSAGTLAVGPNGSIAGPVTVASGATLAGDTGSIETFNINNTLTLSAGSTTAMTLTPASNDQIAGLIGVSYGGTLVVTNSSGSPLVVGHGYTLFSSASAGTGNFSSVIVQPAGAGIFNPTNGVLTITSSGGSLTINPVVATGGNLILTGMGGAAGAGYTLLTTTNIATPMASWTTNTTGNFDGTGAFSNAIPVNVSKPAQFFRIRTP